MKVVHVLKRIEMIDEDIKELRKLEKTIARDKSFSTPIYMSIEKQINLMLGERIKLLELQISNPPETLVQEIEGGLQERKVEPAKKALKKKAAPVRPKPEKAKNDKNPQDGYELEDDISILTQDMIDARINDIRASEPKKEAAPASQQYREDESVKLLDIALEKGTLNRKDIEKEKKVRFVRENFHTD
jgi:hypothetical protein